MAEFVGRPDGWPEYNGVLSDDDSGIDDYDEYMEAERQAFNQCVEESPDSVDEGLEGALLQFQRADGYAWYRVVNEDPLQIEHIPYLDGYSVESALIRGLRREDVINNRGNNLGEDSTFSGVEKVEA